MSGTVSFKEARLSSEATCTRGFSRVARFTNFIENNSIAYVHSQLVITSKFVIPPIKHEVKDSEPKYELNLEALDLVSIVLKQFKLSDVEEEDDYSCYGMYFHDRYFDLFL